MQHSTASRIKTKFKSAGSIESSFKNSTSIRVISYRTGLKKESINALKEWEFDIRLEFSFWY